MKIFMHIPSIDIPKGCQGVDWQDEHKKHGILATLKSLQETQALHNLNPLGLFCLRDVISVETNFLCEPYIPLGKLIIVEGDPGIGKSTLCLKLVAEISQGLPIFNIAPTDPMTVLLICPEDGLEDTIKPRLEKAGGDHSKIFAYRLPMILNEEGKETLRMLMRIGKFKVMVIDPLVSSLGTGTDMHKANDVRAAMSILIEIGQEFGCTIIAVRHLVKGDTSKALYRGIGSIDFTAACRSVLHIGKNPFKKNAGVIFHIKSNLAPLGDPIGYDIVDGKIIWTGKSDIKIEDTMRDISESETKSNSLEDAKNSLKEILKDGPVSSIDVLQQCLQEGFAKRTLNRAKALLKIRSFKKNDGWHWRLEDEDCQGCQDFHAE